jgi:hypothetical protein
MTIYFLRPSALLVMLLLVPSTLLPMASSASCPAGAFADPADKLSASLTLQYSYVGDYPIPMNNSIVLKGRLAPEINGTGTLYWSVEYSGFIYQMNTTFINGRSENPFNFTAPGSWAFRLVFDGDDTYNPVASSDVYMAVVGGAKLNATLTMATSAASSTEGSNITLSGSLSPPYGGSVLLYRSVNGSTPSQVATVPLSAGSYSHNATLTGSGTYAYYAVWSGNAAYNSAASNTVSVTSNAAPQQVGSDSTLLIAGGAIAAAAVIAALIFLMKRKK